MRIGYFITPFPYSKSFTNPELYRNYPVGGAEKSAYHLARQMIKLGHEPIVFTSSIDSKNHIEEQDGIKICRYGTNFKIEKARFSFDMFSKSLQLDVDLVHLHFTLPPSNMAALFYARMKRKPFVVTYHGDAMPDYGRLIRRVGLGLHDKFIVPKILSSAKFIITNSDYYISVSRFLPKYHQKIIAVPQGINPEETIVPYSKEECREKLSLHKEDKIILFVGALINYKSPDLLIKAMPKIVEKTPNARLVIVGDGPLRGELERLISSLSVTQSISLVGSVPYDTVAVYYCAADIFVLPSIGRTESFGMVILEAAAAGLPIVVSSLDTFRAFIVDGYNGLVAKLGDIDSLAETINRLLSDSALKQKIGENARNKVKEYSWDRIARMTEQVYKKAMADV